MLRSIKESYGHKLEALDGEIGRLKSFYFDEQNWAVRYLIAETGTWLTSRQVLISPLALSNTSLAGGITKVNLTRKQIEDSPTLEWHKPVSRRFEEEYYRYYGWPCYWQGGGLWGMSGFPILEPPAKPFPGKPAALSDAQPERADVRLWSTLAVNGYNIEASDGIIGHVCDFMFDARSWSIGQLVVKSGHRLSGKEMMIPTSAVGRIDYEGSTMFINLTGQAVEQSFSHHVPSVGAVD